MIHRQDVSKCGCTAESPRGAWKNIRNQEALLEEASMRPEFEEGKRLVERR